MHIEANAPRILRDQGALFQRVVDALYTVVHHSQQKTTRTIEKDESKARVNEECQTLQWLHTVSRTLQSDTGQFSVGCLHM